MNHVSSEKNEWSARNEGWCKRTYDGYCKEINTIYEYHGDYWHGNPKIYSCDTINKITKTTMGELYKKTVERERKIKELGYNLVVMWEIDWKQIK